MVALSRYKTSPYQRYQDYFVTIREMVALSRYKTSPYQRYQDYFVTIQEEENKLNYRSPNAVFTVFVPPVYR